MDPTTTSQPEPTGSDGPDLVELLRSAQRQAFEIATFDALEDMLGLFVTSHFHNLIQQGCTPEEIGIRLPDGDEIQRIVKELATVRIREQALGKLAAVLGLLLKHNRSRAGSRSTDAHAPAIDQATASTLLVLFGIELSHKLDFSEFIFDPVPLFTLIQHEQTHGALIDDPTWELDPSSSKKHQWTRVMEKSLALVQKAFVDASNAIAWEQQVDLEADLALLLSVDLEQVASTALEAVPEKARLIRYPLPEGESVDPANEEKSLSAKEVISVGSRCRARLLSLCRDRANTHFKAERFEEAEKLYLIAWNGTNGERDPSLLLNRAAALLNLGRSEETIHATSQALDLLVGKSERKHTNLICKAYARRGRARRMLALDTAAIRKILEQSRDDLKQALEISPKDETIQAELQSVEADLAAATEAKPREKTILESPFFRSDLVTSLLADTLRSAAFPLAAVMELLSTSSAPAAPDPADEREGKIAADHRTLLQSITPAQQMQLEESRKNIAAVLALPQYQTAPDASAPSGEEKRWKLLTTSLRLLLGCCCVLSNGVVEAQSVLELVSDALRPDVRGKRGKAAAKQTTTTSVTDDGEGGKQQPPTTSGTDVNEAATEAGEEGLDRLTSQVQGHTFGMLERCCRLQGKRQEGDKYERWLVKWLGSREAAGERGDELMWFVWVVERLNALGNIKGQ